MHDNISVIDYANVHNVRRKKVMQFKDKIEIATKPLIADLRIELASVRSLDVLCRYQFRINLAGPDKE